MATTLTRVGEFQLGQFILGIGTMAFSGSYVTNGDGCDVATVHPACQGFQPVGVAFFPSCPAGFLLEHDLANKEVKIRIEATVATNTPLGEHTAAAIAAGLTGASIIYVALFRRAQ